MNIMKATCRQDPNLREAAVTFKPSECGDFPENGSQSSADRDPNSPKSPQKKRLHTDESPLVVEGSLPLNLPVGSKSYKMEMEPCTGSPRILLAKEATVGPIQVVAVATVATHQGAVRLQMMKTTQM